LKKFTAEKNYIFYQKLQFTYPYASIKDVQVTKKPSALKKEHPALQNIKFHNFFYTFVGHLCPPGSGSESTDLIECGSGSETLARKLGTEK
jgi:hypothetical protein